MGVVEIIVNVKFKLEGQGMTCMFLSYSKNHTADTYRMLNICTKHIFTKPQRHMDKQNLQLVHINKIPHQI